MNKKNKIIATLSLVALSFFAAKNYEKIKNDVCTWYHFRNFDKDMLRAFGMENKEGIQKKDINGDGLEDLFVYSKKTGMHVFLKTPNGEYQMFNVGVENQDTPHEKRLLIPRKKGPDVKLPKLGDTPKIKEEKKQIELRYLI